MSSFLRHMGNLVNLTDYQLHYLTQIRLDNDN